MTGKRKLSDFVRYMMREGHNVSEIRAVARATRWLSQIDEIERIVKILSWKNRKRKGEVRIL